MRRLPKELRQLDAFCERLNPGLIAVCVVLSIMVAAEISAKLPAFLEDAAARAAQASADAMPLNATPRTP